MGCCEARLQKKEKVKFEEEDEDEEEEEFGMGGERCPLSDSEMIALKTQKSVGLLDKYIEFLMGLRNWHTQVSKKEIVIKSLGQSVFTSNVPVILGCVDFEFVVPHWIICELIENDRSWDSSVVDLKVVRTENEFRVERIVRKFPVKNRVFVVRRYFYEKMKGMNYLWVNENTVEEDLSLEQGWCHFSWIRIKDHKGKTFISIVSQIDSVQESNIYLNYISGNELFEWLYKLKLRAIEIYKQSSIPN